MKEICKFNTRPPVIRRGSYKRGYHTLWLNLNITETTPQENDDCCWESVTDKLMIADWSIATLLEKVDPSHLVSATNEELTDLLRAFEVENDPECWKAVRRVQIQCFDQSEKVNRFILNSCEMWLDKATRVGLINSITIEKNAGRNATTLWCGCLKFVLDINKALEILSQLELYALECYNVTASHLASIDQTDSLEELKEFDFQSGYPQVLDF